MFSYQSAQYVEEMHLCNNLIDCLHKLGMKKDLTLPVIAVIGDQSSGKSSVLEALSGVALPRGSGPNEIAGNGRGINEKLISLETTSSNFPHLTLYDLPAINNVEGQLKNIDDQVKNLIKSVISKQETILVVLPCNVDINTSEALKMAREVDPNGERTLGILTKPDLVDKAIEDTVVSILKNDIVYLNQGYMIVKCRGEPEIRDGVSLDQSLTNETDFFENHPHFIKPYEDGKATIAALALLNIKRSLPQLEEKIRMKLTETQNKLDNYGTEIPTEPEQRFHFLTDKIIAFTQDAMNLVIGEEEKCMPLINIFSPLRDEFDLWKKDLDNVGETFDKRIKEELQRYDVKYRGREFPGFINFNTFEVIMREQIKQLEEPAIRRLKKITDIVRKHFIKLAEFSFKTFPNLLRVAKTKIANIKKVKESEAKSMLKTQFKMELMIYTQDQMYKDSLFALMNDINEEEGSEAPFPTFGLYDYLDRNATLEELACHLKSYYRIVVKRLADQVPMLIKYMVLQESAAQLQREMILLIQNQQNIDELLEEDHDINSKRNNLKSRYRRLMEASNYLANF